MRLHSLLASTGALVLALGGCTSDLPAPSNYEIEQPPPPDNELALDCADVPLTAVDASFEYTPAATGQLEGVNYEFSAEGLPNGLTIDANTGTISGTVLAVADSYAFTVTIADVADPDNYSANAACSVDVAPRLSAALALNTTPYCLQTGDDLRSLVVQGTGDGTPITCDYQGGNGNGRLPTGVSVDPDSCTLTGSIDEDRLGTWTFIMRGRQSGVPVHVPYCVTNDQAQGYDIRGSHSGENNATLLPIVSTFDPESPFEVGAQGDPRYEILSPGTCGALCFYRYSFLRSNAPIDDYTLSPDGLVQTADKSETLGFFHELRVSGGPVPDEFRRRPWVLSTAVDYCLSDQKDGCGDVAADGDGSLEFGLIMVPDPG